MNRLLASEPLPVAVVACDWNGTLVSDAERACRATNSVLTQMGLPALDLATFRSVFVLPLALFFTRLGVPADQLDRAEIAWNRCLGTEPAPAAPGAHALLTAAASLGLPVGVVSAAAAAVIEGDAARLLLRDRLSFVVGGANPKRAALARFVAADEGTVVYLGDTEYDVAEALAAGAVPIAVAWGYRPPDALLAAGAWAVVNDLVDVLQLVRSASFVAE